MLCFPVRVYHVLIFNGHFLFPRVQPESIGKNKLTIVHCRVGRVACYILKQRMGGLCAPTHCIISLVFLSFCSLQF